jgi:hypothetical protein
MSHLAQRQGRAPKLKMRPSEHLKRNFVITTSGSFTSSPRRIK